MSLSKKYNISQDTVRQMIHDGWISCSVPSYEKIYADFEQSMQSGSKCKTQAIFEVAEKNKVSESTVFTVIKRFT